MPSVAETVGNILEGTTGTVVQDAFTRGWEASAPVADWPLAQVSEIMDDNTCALCKWLDGKIISRKDPRYRAWLRGSHINCRRIMVYIAADEVDHEGNPTKADFTDPPQELIDRHGHFVAEPKKYAPLRVPARPTGRDFVAYRKAGEQHVTLRWRPGLSDSGLRETLQYMARQFRNVRTLEVDGDVKLAFGMAQHALDRSLIDEHAIAEDVVKHSGAWRRRAGRELTEDEFVEIPFAVLEHPETMIGCPRDKQGRITWLFYNRELPVKGHELDRVLVQYCTERGQVIDWYRVQDPDWWFGDDPDFTPIDWGEVHP